MNRVLLLVALAPLSLATACGSFTDVLTGHARPAAAAAGYTLDAERLGRVLAESPMPDSALTPYWAGSLARLWVDYVLLANLYMHPDSTRSVDYSRLMEDRRYLDVIAVERYHDSVVLAGIEPSVAEMREYFETRQPYTRLDVRRLVLSVPDEAEEAVRDSLYAEARGIRDRLVGGADFASVARERSTEPAQARGQILSYQGHGDFPAGADSVVFALRPGEISPVIAADGDLLIYRVEARRSPDFEAVRDLLRRSIVEERRAEREQDTLDAVLGRARRTVMQGATGLASQIARDPELAAGRIPDGTRLVTWEGGDLSAEELRRLFRVRSDMRQMFAGAAEEEVRDYLLQLARDEILVAAAARSGVGLRPEERQRVAAALAAQLARIASKLGLSRKLVTHPSFDLDAQSQFFLETVMRRAEPLPWLGEFRVVVDPLYPVRVDDVGLRNAARRASELRAAAEEAAREPEEPAEPERELPAEPEPSEEATEDTTVEVG